MELSPVALLLLMLLGLAWTVDRPIIGILTEEIKNRTDNSTSYIAASYVKMVEQSGARVVPVFINRTEDYYRDVLNAVNGILFPGGGVKFTDKGGYADAGRIIMKYAKEMNAAGDHFPVLGVCLGLELIFYLEVESYTILENCNATDVSLSLTMKESFRNSTLYRHMPKHVIDILRNKPVTYNHHVKCVSEQLLKEHHLMKEWHVLSTSVDLEGKVFISSAEHRTDPFVTIQFHPEKNPFEWNSSEHFPHSEEAISTARYFYAWLVNEARKNNHTFSDLDAEDAALIYNYDATYCGRTNYYVQIYLFK